MGYAYSPGNEPQSELEAFGVMNAQIRDGFLSYLERFHSEIAKRDFCTQPFIQFT